MAYIDAMLARGFSIDAVAPYFHFVINIDMDFFEGICKLRAFRKLWARTMKERYGATTPAAMKLRVMTSPSTTSLTLQQPLNNIGRLAIMATACALAGAGETMTTPLHDEAHALPSDDAVRVGAAIQHLVAHETGVADTIDPLAGSYYVETLTKKIEDAAQAEIERVLALGGALKAIEHGYFQRELGREQFRRQRELESGRRKLVGVNHLVTEEAQRELEIWRLAEDMEARQIERLRELRARRDGAAVEDALAGVRAAAADGSNLVEPCLVAVRARATLGEICDAMRAVFGEHHPDSQAAGV
jgi:methylmalonyl-CoA mutase N-terminal domain/subunit